MCYPDGTATIWVPPRGWWALGHEIAHFALNCGGRLGSIHFTPPDLILEKTTRDETLANRFALAWFMPLPLLDIPDWDLIEESGCSAAMVRRRRLDVRLFSQR